MGVLGGCTQMSYGMLRGYNTVIWVTSCQIALYSVYTIFYWIMSKNKLWITLKIFAMVVFCAGIISSVHFFGMKIFHPLGIFCLTLNVADFAAPLAGLRVVIRRYATSTLPLPLCIANFMVSTEWFIYGLLLNDFYLIAPNGIGSLLAFIQLILFVVLPRKPGQRAPIVRLFLCIKGEKAEDNREIVAELGENDEKKINRTQRWSQKIKSNVNTVAEELENVIMQIGINDQFAYTHRISEEDTASEKTVETLDGKKNSTVEAVKEVQMLAAKQAEWERQFQLRRSLRHTAHEKIAQLRRALSSPDLTDAVPDEQ
ncbi:hypothetical protein WR25_20947 isoform B [Diploscapter pachys]|nr:hypothetical protein WR25_20947 isoform B [Diploscapter pachys]